MNRDAKFYFRVTTIIVFALFIGGYSYFQARKLIVGPKIVIESPQNGTSVQEPLVEIKGRATNIKDISLDDRPIFIDEQGKFDEKLLVPPGYTIITMKATDRFGGKTEEKLELYYDAPPVPSYELASSSSSTIFH